MKFPITTAITFGIILLLGSPGDAQVTGLAGWNIYLDPGHSQTENMGVYGYSEAEKNVRVGLHFRDLLLNTTDIDTVYISRTNDNQQVSLSQRTSQANNLGAAWFHSIHSDAGASSANSTLLLWGQLYNGNPDPNEPGGEDMSIIMVDKLTRGMRTTTRGDWGDCSFYGSCSSSWPGPYLHVNRVFTAGPSELSEAGFHTNPVQNTRNMNAEWKRLEAYTFYWSILQYHNIPHPAVDIVTGFVSNLENDELINGATITLDGQSYTTDSYASLFHQYSNDPDQLHNGFYYLEGVADGTHTMVVSAPYYYSDTVSVTLVDTFFTFKDIQLLSSLPPYISESIPTGGDSTFPAWDPIVLNFSRSMEQTSTENAFELVRVSDGAGISGSFTWAQNSTKLYFWPDTTLDFETDYELLLGATAEDQYGHALDGNADSTGGDDFVALFRTGMEDMSPPTVTAAYPGSQNSSVELDPIISLTFDEQIDPATVNQNTLEIVPFPSGSAVPGDLVQYTVNDRSILSFFPGELLNADDSYVIRLNPGYKDLLGNEATQTLSSRFSTGTTTYAYSQIDNFDGGVANWWQPSQSGSTTGTVADSTERSANTEFVNLLTGSSTALEIQYGWDVNMNAWLIREYLGGGAPRSVTFDDSYFLQAYVFGDGSGTRFRFALDDNYPDSSAPNHEVSPWYTVDWYGWRLVSWNMSQDGTGTWLGDGTLEGTLRFDSIQLTYNSAGDQFGKLYIDDLRLAQTSTGIDQENETLPDDFVLNQNYPNPFNPTTSIRYFVPSGNQVNLTVYDIRGEVVKTLADYYHRPGYHTVQFDATTLTSGIYFYRLTAGGFTVTRKMTVVK